MINRVTLYFRRVAYGTLAIATAYTMLEEVGAIDKVRGACTKLKNRAEEYKARHKEKRNKKYTEHYRGTY